MSSAYMGNELRALRDTLGLTELGRAFMTKHSEIFGVASVLTPAQDATALADEPRFFIDHDMVHDRQTGKHVTTEPDSAFNDGILRCCELLNALAEGREPKPFPLLFDNNWLEEKIKTDPDIDCEVGALRATSQTPDAVREENWECSCGGDPKCPNPCRSTPSASAGPQALAVREAMARRLFEASLYGDDEDTTASWDDLSDYMDAPSGTDEYTAELKAAREYWFKLADAALFAHPQPQQADERGAVIEECARVCDWVAEANEIRGKTLPSQSNAQSAAFDKSESAARCAKAVRALQQSPTTERAQAPNFTSQLLDPTNHPD